MLYFHLQTRKNEDLTNKGHTLRRALRAHLEIINIQRQKMVFVLVYKWSCVGLVKAKTEKLIYLKHRNYESDAYERGWTGFMVLFKKSLDSQNHERYRVDMVHYKILRS